MKPKQNVESSPARQSLLALGNRALREARLDEAIRFYEQALKETPDLIRFIEANLATARRRARANMTRPSAVQPATPAPEAQSPVKVAVVVHYFYPEIWNEIRAKLAALPQLFDLFVTVPAERLDSGVQTILEQWPSARIFAAPNLGMDIVPFLSLVPVLANEGYGIVCKLQTKRGDGHLATVWRDAMLDSLIGSASNFLAVMAAFAADDKLCLVGPAALYQSARRLMYGNEKNLSNLLGLTHGMQIPEQDWGFFAGTMFWARVDALVPLAKHASFHNKAFNSAYEKDGKLEHALERFFGLLPRIQKGDVGLLHPRAGKHCDCEVVVCDTHSAIGAAHIGDVMRQLVRIEPDIAAIRQSGYFQDAFYISQNPEIANAKVDLVYHYLTQGFYRGKMPCPAFSNVNEIGARLRKLGDQRNPFLYYVENQGDTKALLAQAAKPSVVDRHFIEKTELFDSAFYLEQIPQLAQSGVDALAHYLEEGSSSELYPNRYFIPREYRALHKDVVSAGFEPFYHYLSSGAAEGRRYRATEWRERDESPFFRYMVLNRVMIDWQALEKERRKPDLVSIVVLAYGNADLTIACLKSIVDAQTDLEYEVVCVDNGSPTDAGAELSDYAEQQSQVRYIRNAENFNFALGCNLGFKAAKGATVVFLNNDTTVTDRWLDELVRPLADPEIGAVQPKLLYPDGTVQNVGIVFAPEQTLGYPIYANVSPELPCVQVSRKYQAITGACLAIRAEDFALLRGFDPIFINGQEDVDLCLRLHRDTKKSCWYQASSVVWHHESKTPGRGKYIKLNRTNFVGRWEGKIQADDFRYYADDGYRITGWQRDSEEFRKLNIAASRPTLEKTAVARMRFNWNVTQEAEVRRSMLAVAAARSSAYDAIRVSIVMPTYNRGDVIGKAIQSALKQSHWNFELLICDDGSVDGTAEVVSRFADSRVRYVRLPHVGVSRARNEGLSLASGEVVAYLDSDNAWDPDYLRIMVAALKGGELDAAYSAISVVDDQDEVACYRGADFLWEECLKENYVDMNAFVHTKASSATLRFDESLKRLVDWDFILRVTKNSRVCYIPFLGVKYYDGNNHLRITRTVHQASADLTALQQLIRDKHAAASNDAKQPSMVRLSYDKVFGAEAAADTYRRGGGRQSIVTTSRADSLVFRIKIGCPNLAVSQEWGDFHFAEAMRRSLEKIGHRCFVDCLDVWDTPESARADVIIVLRGLSRYKPKRGQLTLMWNISHPDKISIDEYNEYDHVFVASNDYAKTLSTRVNAPVSSLLQCTDPTLFNPEAAPGERHELLFVGNSRNVFRKIVRDAITMGLPISVFGTRWEQYISAPYLKGQHVDNTQLAGYYAAANVVLNDHWDTMREFGFISNRLFDALACGALVISDEVPGMRELFGPHVLMYGTASELRNLYLNRATHPSPASRIEFARVVMKEHSFDHRISTILSIVDKLECRAAKPTDLVHA